jgi:SSS family solute:Na+ symporter
VRAKVQQIFDVRMGDLMAVYRADATLTGERREEVEALNDAVLHPLAIGPAPNALAAEARATFIANAKKYVAENRAKDGDPKLAGLSGQEHRTNFRESVERAIDGQYASEADAPLAIVDWARVQRLDVLRAMLRDRGSINAKEVQATLNTGQAAEQNVREVRVPMALAAAFPIGLVGAFAAMMLAAFIATFDSYMLQFGGLFIQDVVLPFRKKPFDPKTHMRLLRISIIMVGLVVYLFSRLTALLTDITPFFFIISSATAGALAVPMLFTLYWNGGTTKGTWCSAMWALAASTAVFLLPKVGNQAIIDLTALGFDAPFRAEVTWLTIWIILLSAVIYVIASRVDAAIFNIPRYDLDKLLHRGQYAPKDEAKSGDRQFANKWERALNITLEFDKGDKLTYYFSLAWLVLNFLVVLIGTIYNAFTDTGYLGWELFWQINLWSVFFICSVVAVWFAIGGVRDFIDMFKRLGEDARDHSDDGMVIDGHNHADEEIFEAVEENEGKK